MTDYIEKSFRYGVDRLRIDLCLEHSWGPYSRANFLAVVALCPACDFGVVP